MGLLSVVPVLMTVIVKSHAFSNANFPVMDMMTMNLNPQCLSRKIGDTSPGHGVAAQTSPSPFKISLETTETVYHVNKPITIKITSDPGKSFKGFFLNVSPFYGSSPTGQAFSCDANGKSSRFCMVDGASHKNSQKKTQVSCTWTPTTPVGPIQFSAWVVQDKLTFWNVSTGTLNPDTAAQQELDRLQQEANKFLSQMGFGSQNTAKNNNGNVANAFSDILSKLASSMGGQGRQPSNNQQSGQSGIQNLANMFGGFNQESSGFQNPFRRT